MQLVERDGRYEAESTYDERTIPKAAGFRWDPSFKVWYTTRPDVAAVLSSYADDELCKRIMEEEAAYHERKEVVSVTIRHDRFECICHFDNRHIPKDVGFRWDPSAKVWYTEDPRVASDLMEHCDDLAEAEIRNAFQEEADSVEASHKMDIDIDIPAPEGLQYLPFQKAGIAYAMERPGCLISDEPGLGKTIQALGVINIIPSIKNVLVVCPASLKINWQRESEKWLVRNFDIKIINGTKDTIPESGMAILNYDVLSRYRKQIDQVEWDMIVYDESHYLKNERAARTKAALGYWHRDPAKRIEPIKAKRRLFLTGTPILSRPVELWTTIHSLDPKRWRSWKEFVTRYCDAHETRWGWDVSGSSNLDELQETLRATVMVRRLKSEVMPELPAKQRPVIVLPPKRSVIKREKKHVKSLEALLAGVNIPHIEFESMSRTRHESAIDKIPDAIDHIKSLMEKHQKVVVMCHHRDVLDAIVEGISEFGSVALRGGDSNEVKQAAVDAFQNDSSVRIFVGSIRAAGVGFTLTAASLIVFVELDWVPGIMTQAEDRLHRIGTKGSILVQHLVFADSIDSAMAAAVVQKQDIIDQALD